MTLRDIRPPEDLATFDASIRQQLLMSDSGTAVSRHLKKDGTVIHVESAGNSAVLNGRRVRLIAINDVTERRRAEAELDLQRTAAILQDKLATMGGLLATSPRAEHPLSVVSATPAPARQLKPGHCGTRRPHRERRAAWGGSSRTARAGAA